MIRVKIHKKPIENRTILNNSTIEIKEGSFNIITGPSGVGKTSLLNIMVYWIMPLLESMNFSVKKWK